MSIKPKSKHADHFFVGMSVLHACLWAPCLCLVLTKAVEGTAVPGHGLTDCCQPCMGLGIEYESSGRAVSALNC